LPLPHKGKESDFFILSESAGSAKLTKEQKKFLDQNYPAYASEPECFDFMNQLWNVANVFEIANQLQKK
jgi:hypothetical protein